MEDETELTIEGMLTFLDPPKESAGKAIAALRDNGVAVKVLTGDNPVVTARICLEVGIDTHDILTGTRLRRCQMPNWRLRWRNAQYSPG